MGKINYLSRDWETINTAIRSYVSRYYPNVAEDQSEASFSSMLFGILAMIGDQVHFTQDYYANEEFISTCSELDSVLKHARHVGYVPFTGNTAIGLASFYAEVPADSVDLGPDSSYLPVLEAGSLVSTNSGTTFILTEDVVFNTDDVRVGRVSPQTGTPTTYIVKNYGTVVSGEYKVEEFSVGDFETFLKLRLSNNNIAEIISVVDSENNEYYQVDNLSQNLIYKSQINFNGDPSNILIPYAAPRRFVFSKDAVSYYLMFGSGSDNVDFNSYTETPQMGLNVYGKKYISTFDMDPNKVVKNDKFGIAPEDTTLTVVYRAVTTDTINAGVGSLNSFVEKNVKILNEHLLDPNFVSTVKNSVSVSNEKPLVGFTSFDSIDELKERVIGHNFSQMRAVTAEDYMNVVYGMPKQFGSIKRCGVDTSFVGNQTFINIFVISEGVDFKLVAASEETKLNLVKWINSRKMASDRINIFDCVVVNLGFDFEILVERGYNKVSVLTECLDYVRNYYYKTFNVGQNFDITEIMALLKKIRGVLDVSKIHVFQKNTGNYSSVEFDLDDNLSVDGKYIAAKQGIIFEIKYPFNDISGSVR